MRIARRFGVMLASATLIALTFGWGTALAADENHGIGLSKGCIGITRLGDPYRCSYAISNTIGIDEAGDTLTFTSLVDTINRPGTPNSGNILQIPGIGAIVSFDALSGNVTPASCSGLGTAAAICTLPSQSRVRIGGVGGLPGFSFYNTTTTSPVPPASDYDVNPVTHVLTDTVALVWQDTCSSGTNNCPQGNQSATTGSSTTLIKRNSATVTDIHNAAHQTVLTVAVGTNVHDFVTVTGEPGQPNPSGNVTIEWFSGTLGNECTTLLATSGPIALGPGGTVDATGFNFTVNSAGFRGFRAHYLGDAMYNPSDGACEPLRVVDANIQITPDDTNRIGDSHIFTGHVNVNDGTGAVNAPDGTQISFTIDSGPGAFTTPNPCTTAGGTGSCTITLTSAVTGVTTVSAHTTVSVGGVSLTRDTNGTGANSGPARKTWVNARISIAPNATNEVGQPHTFVVTLEKDIGTGVFGPAAGEHVDVTLTDSNGATHTAPTGTCTAAGANTNAAGQCTITFSSPTAGQVTGHASSTLVIGGVSITVQTNGANGNSGDAVKTFVDANIQITPATANNPVSTNHTLTGHVNVNAGGGAGYVNAPAGTLITFSLVNAGGATASFVGPNTCLTVGATGSCTIVISSSTTGTTTIKATTTVSVGGVPLTRTTGDGKLGDSADANKTWSDVVVTTQVHDPAHADITNTEVPSGTIVHDEATVTKAAGTSASVPAPTGTVDFTLYNNGTCNGAVVATDPGKPLNAAGVATSATFTTPAVAGSFSYLAHYNGDANYPAKNGPCEPFRVRPIPLGQITPTNVECADIMSGTAPTLAQVNYTVSGGKIAQSINPGVFFYWTTITTTLPNTVVTVSQSNTSTNNAALFTVHQGWDRLYQGDCSSYTSGTLIAGGSGASFTVPTPGTYIIGIKYSAKSIAGTNAPVPADITYNFSTSLGGNTGASVLLKRH